MKIKKKDKRVFNFNLPDDLRDYLKQKSEKQKTTISQCIINLIVKDKNKSEITINKQDLSKIIEEELQRAKDKFLNK